MAVSSSSSQDRLKPWLAGSAWLDAVVVGAVAAILTFGAAGLLLSQVEDDRIRSLDDDAALIFEGVEGGLRRVESDLLATKGLFDASNEVNNHEFNQFVTTMGVLDRVAVMGLIRLVDHADLAAFEQEMAGSIPGYQAFGMVDGARTDPPDVAVHHLVVAMARREGFPDGLGLDASSVTAIPPAVARAFTTGTITTTAPYRFALTGELGIITVLSLESEPGKPPGALITAKHVAELIAEQIPTPLQAGFDVGLTTSVGEPDPDSLLTRSALIEFGGREWRITAQVLPSSSYLAPSWQAPLVLGVALVFTLVAALLANNRSRHHHVKAELAAARAMNSEKDQFLSRVSHELRTPLTMVSGFVKQLLESWDTFSEANRIEFLSIVDEQADEMEWLVQNLLVASRAASGLASVEEVPTDLCELATEVMRRLPDSGVRVLHQAGSETWASVDPLRTRQVVRNLLINAFDHGGSQVEIVCLAKGDEVVIEVQDNGEEVPDTVVASMFDRYSHSESRFTLASVGLGLDVSRTLVELMGGSLSYRREDGITVFSVHLPAAESPDRRPQGASADRDGSKNASSESPDQDLS